MTEATTRGVAGMKSGLDMPGMQVRIGLIIKSFNTIHLRAFCIFRCASHKMCASRIKKNGQKRLDSKISSVHGG